jgi:hypothetical protein
VRVLAGITAVLCGLGGVGCSSVLGIEDPTPDFGDDSGPRTLVSIAIGPDPLALPLGVSQQLTAIGAFSDGSQGDVTAQTEFSEEGGSITVTPAGLARAIVQGASNVTAKIGKISGGAVAMVGPPVPDRLMFPLGDIRIAQLQSARVHVLAVLTDGTMQDVTGAATYTSDSTAIAVASASAPGQIAGASQSGTATITARIGQAVPATMKVTVTTKLCRPVINEFQTGSAASPDDEWVEILNPCTTMIDVAGWTLVYRSATATTGPDSTLMLTLAGQMMPGEIRLIAGPAYTGPNDGQYASGTLGQNNGAIALRMGARDVGPIGDSLSYGSVSAMHPFTETNPLAAMSNGRSAQRLPYDGHDEDNGLTDFTQVATGSPRELNAP